MRRRSLGLAIVLLVGLGFGGSTVAAAVTPGAFPGIGTEADGSSPSDASAIGPGADAHLGAASAVHRLRRALAKVASWAWVVAIIGVLAVAAVGAAGPGPLRAAVVEAEAGGHWARRAPPH